MKPQYKWMTLFFLLASCTSQNSKMEDKSGSISMAAGLANGSPGMELYIKEKGELTYAGYTQIIPIEGMDSRYKLKVSDPGADDKWMTPDDEVALYFRENFTPDGRLLSVETYKDLNAHALERLENIGFDEKGNPTEQAFTREGERFRFVLSYNADGYYNKITRYDGSGMIMEEENFIWNNYWDGDDFIVRRYGVTSHGTATSDFVSFRYSDNTKSKLLSAAVYAEEGNLVKSFIPHGDFSEAVILPEMEMKL